MSVGICDRCQAGYILALRENPKKTKCPKCRRRMRAGTIKEAMFLSQAKEKEVK